MGLNLGWVLIGFLFAELVFESALRSFFGLFWDTFLRCGTSIGRYGLVQDAVIITFKKVTRKERKISGSSPIPNFCTPEILQSGPLGHRVKGVSTDALICIQGDRFEPGFDHQELIVGHFRPSKETLYIVVIKENPDHVFIFKTSILCLVPYLYCIDLLRHYLFTSFIGLIQLQSRVGCRNSWAIVPSSHSAYLASQSIPGRFRGQVIFLVKPACIRFIMISVLKSDQVILPGTTQRTMLLLKEIMDIFAGAKDTGWSCWYARISSTAQTATSALRVSNNRFLWSNMTTVSSRNQPASFLGHLLKLSICS